MTTNALLQMLQQAHKRGNTFGMTTSTGMQLVITDKYILGFYNKQLVSQLPLTIHTLAQGLQHEELRTTISNFTV